MRSGFIILSGVKGTFVGGFTEGVPGVVGLAGVVGLPGVSGVEGFSGVGTTGREGSTAEGVVIL